MIEKADAARATKPLSGYEAVHGPGMYGLGDLATRLLVRRHGTRSVLNFWRQLGIVLLWQDAFKKAFGESVESFYAAFAASR